MIYSSVSCRDRFDAAPESMSASVSRVTVQSLFVGRKLRTPEIRFSRPPSLSLSVSYIQDKIESTIRNVPPEASEQIKDVRGYPTS